MFRFRVTTVSEKRDHLSTLPIRGAGDLSHSALVVAAIPSIFQRPHFARVICVILRVVREIFI